MIHNKFKGLGIALITPFKSDGTVDYEALTRLVEYQIKNGADFLCIMGTTAETPCLTKEEKANLKSLLVERVAGRVPLLMGCG
ncbi:MAG TPA: dihydrodipicolinate synthase family protein, partial [Candidatus Paraprevotella stercorigallinarum]|nr:dihydrodipicolinate synthase family protein [Candidatus Paraprevotella stercorigallinarum]